MKLNIHADKMTFGSNASTLWVTVAGRVTCEAETGQKREHEDACTVFLGGPIEAKMLADSIDEYCRTRAAELGAQAQRLSGEEPTDEN